MNAPVSIERPILGSLGAAVDYFAHLFDPWREDLLAAHVDDQLRCLHISRFPGNADCVDVPLRTIIADALRCNATGLILAHNHPSGNPAPSRADVALTRKLNAAAEAIDVTLVDHLIFTAQAPARSFRKMGLL